MKTLISKALTSVAAVAMMAVWFFALRPAALPMEGLAPFWRLGADILCGAGVYAGALFALWRAEGAPDGVEARALGAAASAARRLSRN